MQPAETDRRFMAQALALAERGLGRVWPNPAVGCVLVKDGRIVARGWTQPGGRPHAETEALARAGAAARGATAYVSLEPCAHRGRTGPCADALIGAGVARVVAALQDSDPRTAGQGLARLSEAGVATEVGVLQAEAETLNRGFFLRITDNRPLVTLKLALTLDGKIAAASGHSQWITGETARRHAHLLRARHDAILVGRATAETDDPELTCRIAGLEDRSPVRVVLSTHARLAPECRLMRTLAAAPLWLIAAQGAMDPDPVEGVEILRVAVRDGRPDVGAALNALADRGITRLLVEGGAETAAAFLRAGFVDRICCYRAPSLIGGDGLSAITALGVADVMRDAPRFVPVSRRALGADVLEVYERGVR